MPFTVKGVVADDWTQFRAEQFANLSVPGMLLHTIYNIPSKKANGILEYFGNTMNDREWHKSIMGPFEKLIHQAIIENRYRTTFITKHENNSKWIKIKKIMKPLYGIRLPIHAIEASELHLQDDHEAKGLEKFMFSENFDIFAERNSGEAIRLNIKMPMESKSSSRTWRDKYIAVYPRIFITNTSPMVLANPFKIKIQVNIPQNLIISENLWISKI